MGALNHYHAPSVPDTKSTPDVLYVTITHEPFLPWFELKYDGDGKTEELDHQQVLEWFKQHGATDMEKVNDAVNHAFNFRVATLAIRRPQRPPPLQGEAGRLEPKI